MDIDRLQAARRSRTRATRRLRLVGVALMLAAAGAPAAVEWPTVPAPDGVIAGRLEVLEDPSAAAALAQIRAERGRFAPAESAVPNFGFTGSAYWFRLPLENRRSARARLYLTSDHAVLDHLNLYVVIDGELRAEVRSGDRLPANARPYRATPLVLPFELPPESSAELYVQVHAEAAVLLVPLRLLDAGGLAEAIALDRLIQGIVLGVFAALFVYNLLIALMLRERAYRYYVLYLLFAYLAITAMNGFGPAALYPGTAWPGNEGLVVFTGLAHLMILLFTRAFLRTAELPRLDRLVKVLLGVAALQVFAVFLMPLRPAYAFNVSLVSVTALFTTAVGVIAWRYGRREARFYVWAQASAILGLLGFGLIVGGVLPHHYGVFQLSPLTLSLAALLHALALADRIRLLQQDKLAAEDAARRSLELRRDQLEHEVAARTAELERARRDAEQRAITDALTGVLNRRGLVESAEREVKLALRSRRPLAVVMFDLDHFKRVNDTYGHAEGDRVLRDVAAAARKAIRDTDLFARVGGEEFLVVLPDTTQDAAALVAERIRARIAEEVSVGSPPQPVTASFGVAWLTTPAETFATLESAADAALYAAKRAGRNRVALSAGESRAPSYLR